MHPGLGLSLLAAAAASFVPLASCASTGIADLYMSPDQDGARTQSIFYVGQPVTCIVKMASGRKDETLLVSFKPLEANGEVLDLPSQLVSNTAPGKTSAQIATLFPPPAVIAFANPAVQANKDLLVQHEDAAVVISATDAVAVNAQLDLLKEIRKKMFAHFADSTVHKQPDESGTVTPPAPDAINTPTGVLEALQVRELFGAHISSTMFHDFADTRNVLITPVADPVSSGSADPKISTPALEAFSAMLNELKHNLNAHISLIVQSPKQTAGKYRCEVDLAGEKKSVDFVILPGGAVEPPPGMNFPRVGMCNGDPVANCPEPPPNKGPNYLKCCTQFNACGSGPRGTPFCY